jgi:hypothetical protein
MVRPAGPMMMASNDFIGAPATIRRAPPMATASSRSAADTSLRIPPPAVRESRCHQRAGDYTDDAGNQAAEQLSAASANCRTREAAAHKPGAELHQHLPAAWSEAGRRPVHRAPAESVSTGERVSEKGETGRLQVDQPSRAAQLTAAGAVMVRSPATTPMRSESRRS